MTVFLTIFQVFFKDLDAVKTEFGQIKAQGTLAGQVLPRTQLENMATRFTTLTSRSRLMLRRLEYEQLKYRLLAFLVAAEDKLQMWTVKYGRKEEVEPLLADYMVS